MSHQQQHRAGGKMALEGLGGPVTMDEYHLEGIDPALEDCCQREVQSNRRYNALTSTLRRHDVSLLADRRRRNLIKTPEFEGCRCCLDPNADGGEYRALIDYKAAKQAQQQTDDGDNEHENDENMPLSTLLMMPSGIEQMTKAAAVDTITTNDDDSDDDEFDYLLDEDLSGGEDDTLKQLEEARRAELEYQLLMRQAAGYHGYGVSRQIHPTRVLKMAGLGRSTAAANSGRAPPPAVVLHLVDPDSVASASLDYYLETELAKEHAGTMFLRSGGRSTLLMDPLAQQSLPSYVTEPERDLPALIAIRDGVVVNACPKLQGLTTTSNSNTRDAEVEPSAVKQWLDRCGVLLTNPPPVESVCFISPEEDALLDYMSTQQPQPVREARYDCGLEGCHKTFKHEHVGIQTSTQSGLVVPEEEIVSGDADS